jgi:chloramphenicol 3-O phosphotransferase
MAPKGRIIILNGVGSAGKNSIAKALQKIAATPWLHIEMDAFCAMLPELYQDHSEGFAYRATEEDGKPVVIIDTGPVGARVMRGMRRAIAAMAAEGNDLIVDDVLLGDARADYEAVLAGFETHWVGVMAPLEDASPSNAVDRPLPGKMTGYSGPEKSRSDFRRKQTAASKKTTEDVLQVLRTRGSF